MNGVRYCSACGLRWVTPAVEGCPLCETREQRDRLRQAIREMRELVLDSQRAIDSLRRTLFERIQELGEEQS